MRLNSTDMDNWLDSIPNTDGDQFMIKNKDTG